MRAPGSRPVARLFGRRAVAPAARPVPTSCIGTPWALRPEPPFPKHGLRFAIAGAASRRGVPQMGRKHHRRRGVLRRDHVSRLGAAGTRRRHGVRDPNPRGARSSVLPRTTLRTPPTRRAKSSNRRPPAPRRQYATFAVSKRVRPRSAERRNAPSGVQNATVTRAFLRSPPPDSNRRPLPYHLTADWLPANASCCRLASDRGFRASRPSALLPSAAACRFHSRFQARTLLARAILRPKLTALSSDQL
jgi:hypothetical protein